MLAVVVADGGRKLTAAVFLAALVASCLRGALPKKKKRVKNPKLKGTTGHIGTDHRWTCGQFAVDSDDGEIYGGKYHEKEKRTLVRAIE